MIPGQAQQFFEAAAAQAGGGYEIERSLRFNSGDSAYLNKSFPIAGNRKTWTWSGWLKRSTLSSSTSDVYSLFAAYFDSSNRDVLRFTDNNGANNLNFQVITGGTNTSLYTSSLFRDVSAWYHIVLAFDTTQASASDRVKIYVNNVLQTWSGSAPAQNAESVINDNFATQYLGARSQSGSAELFYDGYLTNVEFIDGQALDPSAFGEDDDNNVWQPKLFAGSYGPTRSVNQTAQRSSSTGYVDSDNPSGKSSANIFDGSLTTYVSGRPSSTVVTLANSITANSSIRFHGAWEDTNSRWAVNGTATDAQPLAYTNNYTFGWSEPTNLTFPLTITSVGVLNAGAGAGGRFVAVEVDGELLVDPGINVAPNNGFKLTFSDGSSESALGTDSSGNGNDWTPNNFSPSTQADYSEGFDVLTWTGDGSASRAITGLQFSPGLLWIKRRNTALDHFLWDSVRGITKELYSNENYAEGTATNKLESFDSNGFTVKNSSATNATNDTYVAWCWKAGGTPSNNTDGTITTSVSVDTTHGFAVAKWQTPAGQGTIGTGLSTVDFAIIKTTTGTGDWYVWSKAYSNSSQYLILNTQAGIATSSDIFAGGGAVGGGLVALGALGNPNAGMIAYCWQEIEGFSKFGSTTVPGSGTQFVEVGFKPKFLIIKRADVSGYSSWALIDSERGTTYDNILWADHNYAQGKRGNGTNAGTYLNVTFSNTGFTYSSGHAEFGQPNTTNYYFAFADTPPASAIDSLIDTPTDYEASSGNNGGNYCTLNPLDKASTQTVSDGNLQLNINQALPTFATTKTTFGISSGKFYWEFIKESSSSFGTAISGIWPTDETSPTLTTDLPANIGSYTDLLGFGVTGANVQFRMMPSGNVQSGSYTQGQVIGIAFDADAGKFYAFINGSEISGQDIAAGTSVFDTVTVGKTYVPFGYNGNGGSGTENVEMTFNFGQRAYAYPPGGTGGPPSDYKSVCTTNLTDPTIAQGATVMSSKTYQGNNTFPRSIAGLGFSPDLVWTKVRSQAYRHMWFDTVRGTGKNLTSNNNNAETTDDAYGYISAFNNDGWTIAEGSTSGENFNKNGDDYVAWSWDGGALVTNSAYNQSEEWSTFGDSNAKANENWFDVFDGSLTAAPHVVAQSGTTTVWTLSTPITFTKLELYANNDGYGDITLNGNISTTGTIPAGGGANIGWADVTSLISNNTLTSIEVPNAYNTDPTRLGAIKVDDKYLLDPGVIPVGGLNSSFYDQSQTWSSGTYSGTTPGSGYEVAKAFNGVGSPGDSFGTGKLWGFYPGSATLTLPAAITLTASSTVELYTWHNTGSSGNITFTCSNGSVAVTPVDNANIASTVVSNPFTTFGASITAITVNSSGSDWTALAGIVIDGKLLVDSGVSVTNVPSIASTVRANPSAGFSIASYTGNGTAGATVAHGLNANVALYFIKNRSNAADWAVLGHALNDAFGGSNKFVLLNSTAAAGTAAQGPGDTSTIELYSDATNNTNGDDYIAYCFASVEGYSAFGSYTGNGSAEGPYVYTGFRPQFVMIKNATATAKWVIQDTTRSRYNPEVASLYPDSNIAEYTGALHVVDYLSNGFKVRSTDAIFNSNAQTYFYAAFASHPFKTARAR